MQIHHQPLRLQVHGYSATALNKDYTGTAFRLMDSMWKTVKTLQLENKGQNIIVYGEKDSVFAGVELLGHPAKTGGLEQQQIHLERYAYHQHIGPYALIKAAGLRMREELKGLGMEIVMPYIEIYGHWNSDESKLETALFMALK